MFVINLKLNMKKIFIIAGLLLVAASVLFELNSNTQNNLSPVANSSPKYDYILTEENFTEILENLHTNISENINKTVKISGFVFRMPDFKEDIFVCGRNIIIDDEENIAGILCQSNDAKDLKDNEWVEVTGIITQGDYNTTMPIIKVNSIKKIEPLENSYVEQ